MKIPGLRRPEPKDARRVPFVDEGLSSMAKWATAGFSALIAILAALGIEKGLVLRLASAHPKLALYVFILLGVGTLCGLLAIAVSKEISVRVSWLIAVVTALGIAFLRLLPDFYTKTESSRVWWVVAGLFVLAGFLVVVGWDWKIALPAGFVLVGVAAISMGLYAAVKLTFESGTVDRGAAVSAELGTGEEAQLKVHVHTTLPPDRSMVDIRVLGVKKKGAEVELLRAKLPANNAGEIDETILLPVPSRSGWTGIRVRHCKGDDSDCVNAANDIVRFSGLPATPASQDKRKASASKKKPGR